MTRMTSVRPHDRRFPAKPQKSEKYIALHLQMARAKHVKDCMDELGDIAVEDALRDMEEAEHINREAA